jgi:hypothetical protein
MSPAVLVGSRSSITGSRGYGARGRPALAPPRDVTSLRHRNEIGYSGAVHFAAAGCRYVAGTETYYAVTAVACASRRLSPGEDWIGAE